MKRLVGAAIVILGLVLAVRPAEATVFVMEHCPATIREDTKNAKVILYGYMARSQPGEKEGEGLSEFHVLEVLKFDPAMRKAKVLFFPIHVPIKDPANPTRYVLYCDIQNGHVDPWRGDEVTCHSLVHYVKQAVVQSESDRPRMLARYYQFLDHENKDLRIDAHRELRRADFKDMRAAAKHFDPDRILRWMQDPALTFQRDIHALLLGVCGQERHALFLRECLAGDVPAQRADLVAGPWSLNRVFAAFALLKPQAGLACIQSALHDPHEAWAVRYHARLAARFLVEDCPGAVSKDQVAAMLLPALSQSDLADFVIEDLRRWRQWGATDKVLTLADPKRGDQPKHVQRAVLRFALASPDPRAAAFVREQRRLNPEWVQDNEDLLGLEKVGE